jgi:hypothetical protein
MNIIKKRYWKNNAQFIDYIKRVQQHQQQHKFNTKMLKMDKSTPRNKLVIQLIDSM